MNAPVPSNLPRFPFIAVLLVVAVLLLPFGRMVEMPMLLLSIAGVIGLWRRPSWRGGAPWGCLLLLYIAFVLPMIFSLPDAVAGEKSLLTTIGTLRYGLSCCALLWFWESGGGEDGGAATVHHAVGLGVAFCLLFWGLDGFWQFLTGHDVLGYGRGEGYINALFGEDDNIKFGITLALLAPLGVIHGFRHWRQPWAWALLLLCLVMVMLSGKRGAWITLIVELAAMAAYYRWRGSLDLRRLALPVLAILLALAMAFSASDWVQTRSRVLVNALDEPSYDQFYAATAKRLPIWGTAWRMGNDNWLNGVGPRGFRYAYSEYAAPDDHWARPASGAGGSRGSHAHQLLLELYAETGVPGLVGYLAIGGLLIGGWLRAGAEARSRAMPYGVALIGMLWPANTHAAWYSSWSGLLFWFFVGLYLMALAESPGRSADPGKGS